ncbi:MAG: glycoside hydrolase family 2 TIM barrel-domain containing protein [Calditrichia bacterium]
MKSKIPLKNWRLYAANLSDVHRHCPFPENGLPVEIPGTVHTDLLAHQLIPDPYFEMNEKMLQWVHETQWVYECEIPAPGVESPLGFRLVFEGLDTIARIFWNGELLGSAENMFRRYEFLLPESSFLPKNRLRVEFEPPLSAGCRLEAQYGKLPVELCPPRVHLRKAQYSFGWDWGPAFPTVGIWKPVYLEPVRPARLRSVLFRTVEINGDMAVVEIEAATEEISQGAYFLRVVLEGHGFFREELLPLKGNRLRTAMTVENPCLWWPRTEGDPALYQLRVFLKDESGNVLNSRERQVGIRTVELETECEGQPCFRFRVNGRTLFVRGANWIPADAFLPRVTPEIYQKMLKNAASAGMNMIRVWGGGIYEDDTFYEACDRLGLLVWQDFMFACAPYPQYEPFLQNIRQEAAEQIERLQTHPSLGLWCGNNECQWAWYMDTGQPANQMPGAVIFHNLLPERTATGVPYWPGSPFGNEKDPNHPGSGNRHQWDMWSGYQDFTAVAGDRSLFVTEFGFQAPANQPAWNTVLRAERQRPQDEAFEFHNKQMEGPERLLKFIATHLPLPHSWNDLLYLGQLFQGLAVQHTLLYWRSRWPQTAGTIIWQLNDCWPVTSWSIVDYLGEAKTAWYLVRRAFAPQTLFLKKENGVITAVLSHLGRENRAVHLRLQLWNGAAGRLEKLPGKKAFLKAGSNVALSLPVNLPAHNDWLLLGSLYDKEGNLLNRHHLAGKALKYLTLPSPKYRAVPDTEGEVRLTAENMLLFPEWSTPVGNAHPRGEILLPGEEIVFKLPGGASEGELVCLNRYLI